MTGIVLQTNAVKVENHGGGYPTKMIHEEIDAGMGIKKKITRRMISTKKIQGTDYVVFICPAPDCGKRNRKSVYEAKASTGDGRLSFKCHACRREVEVQKPMGQMLTVKQEEKPPTAPQFKPGTILGPDGLPARM
jgi:hypothetical protein